jgi:glycosyltransferase involved in cell wall biosynthesis
VTATSIRPTLRTRALRRAAEALLPVGSRRRRWMRRACAKAAQYWANVGFRLGKERAAWTWLGPRLGPDAILPLAAASRGVVIFLPSLPWKLHLPQPTHQMAREFARQGYLAIYDCTGCLCPDAWGFRQVEPNLLVFHGPRVWLSCLPDAILWTLSYNFSQRDAFPPHFRTVYDWIDDLSIFDLHGRDLVAHSHRRAIAEATVVASVSPWLHAEAIKDRPDALYLPNGVDEAHFGARTEMPDDPQVRRLRDDGKPVAGYVGALASWFDYALVERVAIARPDWNFLLIGPRHDESLDHWKPLLELPNVFWIGPRPYEGLPGYLRLCDVAMLPRVMNDITRSMSPLKLHEFFAAGKPVISSRVPACASFAEVHVVDSAEEFSRALDAALAESRSDEFCRRLRGIAHANSWSNRVQAILAALDRGRPLHAERRLAEG